MKKFLLICMGLFALGSVQAEVIKAGPIWSNAHAQKVCPRVCSQNGMDWQGQWWTTVQGRMSVCQCTERYSRRPAPVKKLEVTFNRNRIYNNNSVLKLKTALQNQHRINLDRFKIQGVTLVAKSKQGNARAKLVVGNATSRIKKIAGNPRKFRKSGNFDHISFQNPKRNSKGNWQVHLKGNVKVKKVIVKLKRKPRR